MLRFLSQGAKHTAVLGPSIDVFSVIFMCFPMNLSIVLGSRHISEAHAWSVIKRVDSQDRTIDS